MNEFESREMQSIFTIDVEDWFHILDVPSTPSLAEWDLLPTRVETNFMRLLDILSERGVSSTCFFLGWIAKKFPHLVREADRRGHEIASHGYAHRLVGEMTPLEFAEDISTSKAILEDVAGQPVCGYRAPGFSISSGVPWYFHEVAAAGYEYDASVFPAPREHGGLENGLYGPYAIRTDCGSLVEFPMTVAKLMGKPVCVFGGGYLRLAPVFLIERMMRQVLKEGRPVICYVHPREIDAQHPRLRMGLRRRFKSYVNLRTTEGKIRHLLSRYEFTSFRAFRAENALHGVEAEERSLGSPGRARHSVAKA